MNNKTLIFAVICLISVSCNNVEIEKMQSEINQLKKENKKLANAFQENLVKKFTSSFFVVTSQNEYLTVNSENRLKISLATIDTIPEFNIYSVDKNYERTLIMENLTKSVFEYSFTPSSLEDNEINLSAILTLPSGDELEFPINSKFVVK